MNTQLSSQLSLIVESDLRPQASAGVGAYSLDPGLMVSLGRYIQAGGLPQSLLRVIVVQTGSPVDGNLPDVFGSYQVLQDGIRFIPHFPFERGLSYRAIFDPRPFGHPEHSEVLSLEFSLPRERSPLPPKVKCIFPSGDYLPENLLRLYVCFSNSMQHGQAETEISLLGPDGGPATDVLYRAPVELWDRSMQYLTILLDPGRLKRGVGPNRELGPPLKVGQEYTLAVGPGMVDLSGRRLRETFHKRFRVTEAVRKPILVEEWTIVPPATNSRHPLVLIFPTALDWALLSETIVIVSAGEQSVEGRIVIDKCERQWSFTPASLWAAGYYHIHVASTLEDVCGNSVIAAFDRPLRAGSDLAYEMESRSVSFKLV